jgi:hypothetical protein
MLEPGGRGTWLHHRATVRDGPVLMCTQLVEFLVGEGVEPEVEGDRVDRAITTMTGRIG